MIRDRRRQDFREPATYRYDVAQIASPIQSLQNKTLKNLLCVLRVGNAVRDEAQKVLAILGKDASDRVGSFTIRLVSS